MDDLDSQADRMLESLLDVADMRRIGLTTIPQGEAIISLEMPRGQVTNRVFLPKTFAKLEAPMAKVHEAQDQLSRCTGTGRAR